MGITVTFYELFGAPPPSATQTLGVATWARTARATEGQDKTAQAGEPHADEPRKDPG